MKIVSVLLISFLLINSIGLVIGDVHDDVDTVLETCRLETNATLEDVETITNKQMPTTHSGLCLLACLYESAGIIENEKFVVENLAQVIGFGHESAGAKMLEEFNVKVMDDCRHVHNDDKCVLAKDIITCAAKSVAKHKHMLKQEL